MTENRMMGKRYDGGVSPLGVPVSPGTLEDALRLGRPTDIVIMPGTGVMSTVGEVSNMLKEDFGVTYDDFVAMKPGDKDRLIRRVDKRLRRHLDEARGKLNGLYAEKNRLEEQYGCQPSVQQLIDAKARTVLHETTLTAWSRGVLTLEKPQASSLHHLVRYDARAGDRRSFLNDAEKIQNIVVEHDWAKALPPSVRGEWRLPFERCCWEFRVSGVRVLVFTFAEDVENPKMVLTYGKDGHWVSDDYIYHLGGDACIGRVTAEFHQVNPGSEAREFRRVVDLVWANIRAACIMLEAPNVCEREERQPSDVLVARARRERIAAPRAYMVVRLMNMDRRRAHYRRAGGGGASGVRQGGHWRRGTWVHYDDQDSGQVQYVNDGGFMVSKTWRSWHFAGDPDRLVEKEYRL